MDDASTVRKMVGTVVNANELNPLGGEPALVLAALAEECGNADTAKTIWHNLAQKMKATAKAVVVALILVVSATSGHYPPQRIRSIP